MMIANRPTRSATLIGLALCFALILAACGGSDDATSSPADSDESTAPAATDAASSADDAGDDSQEADDGNDSEPGGLVDGSSIDWATVDLATIDWANIDLSTLDFAALADNPTAETLSEETVALIQARMAENVGSGHATLTIGDETWEFEGFVCAIGYANTESDVFSLSTNAFGTHSDGTPLQMQADIADDSGEDRLSGPGLTHGVSLDDIEDFDTPAVKWRMTSDSGITIDGFTLTAEGTFDDGLTPELEDTPGTLVAECGPGSRI